MSNSNEASATSLTLSFKFANLTVLLYAEPLTPMSKLKSELLETLCERYPNGLSHVSQLPEKSLIPHPSKSTDIVLGKLVRESDDKEEEEEWEEICQGGGIKDTPKSLGLENGSYLAFAYREVYEESGFEITKSTFYNEQSKADEEELRDSLMEDAEEDA